MTDYRVDNKVALVTGGSRGVGRGVAEHLAAAGATVYVTGRTVHAAQLPKGMSAERVGDLNNAW